MAFFVFINILPQLHPLHQSTREERTGQDRTGQDGKDRGDS